MSTTTLSLDALVEFLRSLDDKSKRYIFEQVFVVSDTSPLTGAERKSLKKGISEYRKGRVIEWKAGK